MIKVLELRKIKKNIKDRNILTIEKLILPSNGIVFIDGESGAGKSTLLNIIGSLDTPTTGDVIFNGQSIYDKQYNINDYRKNAIGIVFQDNDLFEHLSVKDNLKTYDINEIKIQKVLHELNIIKYGNKRVSKLSGGEKRLVSIARALIKSPQILILDEPFASLDEKNRINVLNILKGLSENTLILISSHNIKNISDYADRVIFLADGKILSDDIKKAEKSLKNGIVMDYKINKKIINRLSFIQIIENKFNFSISIFLLAICIFLLILSCSIKFDFDQILIATLKNENIKEIYYEEIDEVGALGNESKLLHQYFINDKIGCLSCSNIFPSHYNLSAYYELGYRGPTMFAPINDSIASRLKYGRLPISDDEIIVSSYSFDIYATYGLTTLNHELYKPSTYDDIINHQYLYGNAPIKIVGIYDTYEDEFYDLKDDYNYASDQVLLNRQTYRRLIFTSSEISSVLHYSTEHIQDYLAEYGFVSKPTMGKRVLLNNYDDMMEYLNLNNKKKYNLWDLITGEKYIELIGTKYASATGAALTSPFIIIKIFRYMSILIVLLTIFILFYSIKSFHIKNNKNISILRSLGFNSRYINKLMLNVVMIYIFIGFLIATILSVISVKLMNFNLTEEVGFYLYPYKINLTYLVIIFVLLVTIILITWILLKFTLKKKNELVYLKNN